jgi:1-deoxyxylulose-5-phosphate synthase
MALPHTRLGKSGIKVSRICLGTMGFGSKSWREWVVEERDSVPIIRRAIDLGINFIDTADVYSLGESERIVGKAIDGRRDDLVLATKVCNPMGADINARGLSRRHILNGMKASLERLGVENVDLYQVHRYDHDTPQDETGSTMSSLVDFGMTRYIGASTMWAWQFAMALGRQREHGWHPYVTMQTHYNLAYREEEREMIPLSRNEGVGILPWSPLARGFLAGRAKRETGTRARTDGASTSTRRTKRSQPGSTSSPSRRGFQAPTSRWPGCLRNRGSSPRSSASPRSSRLRTLCARRSSTFPRTMCATSANPTVLAA